MRFAALACLVLLFSACDTGVPNALGSYSSVEFTEPGPADGTVDVLASGGWATLNLDPDGSFQVVYSRPLTTGTGSDVSVLTGTYRQRGDRIVFDADGDTPALIFSDELIIVPIYDDSPQGPVRLVTPDLSGHAHAFRLVFEGIGIL